MPSRTLILPGLATLAFALYAAPLRAGCSKDADCKGERICSPAGQCVDPRPCPPCPCAEPPAPPITPAPAPAPPPVRLEESLVVTMVDASPVTGIEVVCPSGFRQRATLDGHVGTIAGVPDETCTLHFKGPVSARFSPVHRGQALACRIEGTTAICD